MTYFELGNYERAEQYLETAIRIDPGHFSHPQLLLAEIHIGKNQPQRGADDLENFLLHHPDWPKAMELRTTIQKLREEKK